MDRAAVVGPWLPTGRRGRGDARPSPGWRTVAILVLTVALAIRLLLLAPVAVRGDSMSPTVVDGGVVLVWLRASPAAVDRGQLVVFRDPTGELALKRVVGLPGDDVVILDAELRVNGTLVEEPYVDHADIDGLYTPQVTVPDGHLFVLGDNRGLSVDSRLYGPIPFDAVVGRVANR